MLWSKASKNHCLPLEMLRFDARIKKMIQLSFKGQLHGIGTLCLNKDIS